MNFPLIGPKATAPDFRGPVALLMYRPGEWKREIITENEEGVVHGILPVVWDPHPGESLLSGSFLGVFLLQFHPGRAGRSGDRAGRWTRTPVVKGHPAEWPKSGTSDAMVGHLGRERFLATIEPWHGNEIVVYRERDGSWRRHVIDETPVDAHTIVAGDFDGDGGDEIVVGERQGRRSLYLYRLASREGDDWTKTVLDDRGMAGAGCAVADLNADGRADVVCIGTGTANLKWYENRP